MEESNAHAPELQWGKVKNGAIMSFFSPLPPLPPQWLDTVITVHLEGGKKEKLQLHILSYPSICALSVFHQLFCDHVLPFMSPVHPLVSAVSI